MAGQRRPSGWSGYDAEGKLVRAVVLTRGETDDLSSSGLAGKQGAGSSGLVAT